VGIVDIWADGKNQIYPNSYPTRDPILNDIVSGSEGDIVGEVAIELIKGWIVQEGYKGRHKPADFIGQFTEIGWISCDQFIHNHEGNSEQLWCSLELILAEGIDNVFDGGHEFYGNS